MQDDICKIIRHNNWSGIYAFQNPLNNNVKIGYGVVAHRFDAAKTWVPNIVWLADTCPFGCIEEERSIHLRLAHYQQDREWFCFTPELAFYLWDCFGIRTYNKSFSVKLIEFVNSDVSINRVIGSEIYDPPMGIKEMSTKLGELKHFIAANS